MKIYTAEQLTKILRSEGYTVELRTVKYYAQIGVLSERPKVHGRRVFTDQHLEELRAVLTLKKTGKRLSEIKQIVSKQPTSTLRKISDHSYLSAEYILEHERVQVHPQIQLQFHREVDPTLKKRVIAAIEKELKGDEM